MSRRGLQAGAPPRGWESQATEPAEEPTATPPAPSSDDMLRPRKELLTAWLLHLLRERATYGYQLRRDLQTHGISVDSGTMYRRLSKLEESGLVQSRWMKPVKGPRRRLYRLTAKGRRALAEIAGLITAIHDAHDAFIVAYERRRPARAASAADADAPTVARSTRSAAPAPGRKLLTAWLLLFLRDNDDSYGYDLDRRLAQVQLIVDRGVLYRRLRTLEQEGRVASHWGDSAAGPRPRVYELTSVGRRDLDELARKIEAIRGAMNAFLQAHDR